MKASTILIAFALIVAVSTAQSTNTSVNATGVSCVVDKAACTKLNPLYCCANVVRYINATYSNTTQQCVNQTVVGGTKNYTSGPVIGNATCIVSTSTPTNNSVLVKLSVAVASLGFLSLFL